MRRGHFVEGLGAAQFATGRLTRVELARIDSGPAAEHPTHDTLIASGFTPGYRGPTLRP